MPDRNAFSLIEMLVTIAIITILTMIAIPQYTKYKKNAAVAAAEAMLYNCINSKLAQFAADEDETLWCEIGDQKKEITITNEGLVQDAADFIQTTIKGIKVICDIKDGMAKCRHNPS